MTYQRRQGARKLIRKAMALPFLPGEHAYQAFEMLNEQARENTHQMTDLFNYIDEQWFKNSLWSPREWSVYKQVTRTNNDVEGKCHTSIFLFVGCRAIPDMSVILRGNKCSSMEKKLSAPSELIDQKKKKYALTLS